MEREQRKQEEEARQKREAQAQQQEDSAMYGAEDDDDEEEGWGDQDEWDEAMDEYGNEDQAYVEAVNAQIKKDKETSEYLTRVKVEYHQERKQRFMDSRPSVMAIAGEFNQWVPQNMTEAAEAGEPGRYSVELKLMKGFRYRFCFFERPGDQPIVDKSGRHAQWSASERYLPFGLKETNYIEVQRGNEEAVDFPEAEEASEDADLSPLPLVKNESYAGGAATTSVRAGLLEQIGRVEPKYVDVEQLLRKNRAAFLKLNDLNAAHTMAC